MNTFILILVGLNLGVPVRCYETPAAWEATKIEVNSHPQAVAFFNPNAEPYIAIGPKYCREIRRPTIMGAFVLGHELGHFYQYVNQTPFDEAEADDLGRIWSLGLLKKLERVFKRKAPALVTLAP